jgi:hypothetical protein
VFAEQRLELLGQLERATTLRGAHHQLEALVLEPGELARFALAEAQVGKALQAARSFAERGGP